ncbi:MAG: hypothetical protein ACP5NZ_03215 [Nanobdellota archaeon]
MDERTFNSLMPRLNEIWVANVLNMQINSQRGPDLIDNLKAVEVKFKMLYSNGKYTHKCWRVLGHQVDYDKAFQEIYWGLGFYRVNKEVNEVKRSDLINLEKIVDYREIYLVNWDWVKQFPVYHHNGKTKLSEWDYLMLFPKFNLLPGIISEEVIENGKVFFTEGVNPARFNINPNPNKQKHYKDAPF